jgi:hypothetical protein
MPIDYDRRRHVTAPRPAAHATAPPRQNVRNVHPVQPAHASAAAVHGATHANTLHEPVHASQVHAPTHVPAHTSVGHDQGHGETLPHAIARMRDQGYSVQAVEGQIRRWHPGWSSTQINAAVRATRNPITAVAKQNARLPKTAGTAHSPIHASVRQNHHSVWSHWLPSVALPHVGLHPGRDLHWLKNKAIEQGAAALAIPTYLSYYGAYEVRHHIWNAPGLRTIERLGLHGDMYLDRVEYAHGDPRTEYDEGVHHFQLGPVRLPWWRLPGAHGTRRHHTLDY